MPPIDTPADVSGGWTMTIGPSPSCRAGLPEIARGRSYHLDFRQQGTGLQITLSAPTLKVNNPHLHAGIVLGSRIRLVVFGDTGDFSRTYVDWSAPDIVDHLGPTELFGFDGVVNARVAGSLIHATLSGDLVYHNSQTDRNEPTWYCRAQDHQITLRR
jgi:hypothetical protein